MNQHADFVIQLPDEGCVVFADDVNATKRKIVRLLVGPPVRFPQTKSERYPPEPNRLVACTSSGLAQKNNLVFDFGRRAQQVLLQVLAGKRVEPTSTMPSIGP